VIDFIGLLCLQLQRLFHRSTDPSQEQTSGARHPQHDDRVQYTAPENAHVTEGTSSISQASQPASDPIQFEASTPYGGHHYSLDASRYSNLSTLSDASIRVRAPLENIQQRYDSLMQQREVVRDSLFRFKQTLHQPEDISLLSCFKDIKKAVGKGVKIDIVQGENPHVEVEECILNALPEAYKSAIGHLNTVLKNSRAFLNEKQEVIDLINSQLIQIRRDQYIQTRAGFTACSEVEKWPKKIEESAEELKRLLHDIDVAKSKFEDSVSTGLLLVLNNEENN